MDKYALQKAVPCQPWCPDQTKLQK